eukprot:CAMPEP_0179116794 /NCGR_PEP_ID=MMETSP0796-20121207/54812_1 /TAXON_ID=73915 /ORGANISM="Pyrodinium bahamense, Strain pbaha01" /LENGTH=329 /DNA_ID=CAMNT_0020815113 /DNA_START=53 /DNA_END=1041 /DNA_ORIENTATION=+
MTVGQQMLSLACLWAVRGQLQLDAPLSDPLASDDACSTGGEGPEACHLGLLQKRQQMDVPDFEEAEEDFDTAFAEVPRDLGIFLSQAGDAAEGGAMAANSTLEGELTEAPRPKLALPVYWSSRRDIVGIERCYGANTGYCNALMYKARGACSGSSCVLIVNPPGHCTQTPLHIHAYHYNGRGAALKRQLSAKAATAVDGRAEASHAPGGRCTLPASLRSSVLHKVPGASLTQASRHGRGHAAVGPSSWCPSTAASSTASPSADLERTRAAMLVDRQHEGKAETAFPKLRPLQALGDAGSRLSLLAPAALQDRGAGRAAPAEELRAHAPS